MQAVPDSATAAERNPLARIRVGTATERTMRAGAGMSILAVNLAIATMPAIVTDPELRAIIASGIFPRFAFFIPRIVTEFLFSRAGQLEIEKQLMA